MEDILQAVKNQIKNRGYKVISSLAMQRYDGQNEFMGYHIKILYNDGKCERQFNGLFEPKKETMLIYKRATEGEVIDEPLYLQFRLGGFVAAGVAWQSSWYQDFQ